MDLITDSFLSLFIMFFNLAMYSAPALLFGCLVLRKLDDRRFDFEEVRVLLMSKLTFITGLTQLFVIFGYQYFTPYAIQSSIYMLYAHAFGLSYGITEYLSMENGEILRSRRDNTEKV